MPVAEAECPGNCDWKEILAETTKLISLIEVIIGTQHIGMDREDTISTKYAPTFPLCTIQDLRQLQNFLLADYKDGVIYLTN